jgi:hypothetical protein
VPDHSPRKESRIRLALALAFGLVGCAHPTEQQLHPPVRLWNDISGLCGSQIAVDGDGVLWREGGCENGVPKFESVRKLSDDEVRRIDDAFAKLPPSAPETTAACPGMAHVFSVRTSSGVKKWVSCKTRPTDPAPLPPPFDEVARTLDLR